MSASTEASPRPVPLRDNWGGGNKLKPRHSLQLVIITIAIITASIIMILFFYSLVITQQQIQTIDNERIITMHLLANKTELRFNDATKILQIISKSEDVRHLPAVALINKNLHGIPENADMDERNMFREIVEIYASFDTVEHIMPNGDVYLVEPYHAQKSLTVSNVSFRDYFKQVTRTHDSYISPVSVSLATKHRVSVIAVPILSENGTLTGIISGALNLDVMQKRISQSISYPDERILLVDNDQIVVADSSGELSGNKIHLGIGAIQKALDGESGTMIGTINGTKMYVSYYPIQIDSNTWAIVSIQHYDDAFLVVNNILNESLLLIVIVLLMSIVLSLFIIRSFRVQTKITKELEESETKYRSLFDLSPDAILVMDENRRIISCNKEFVRETGYSEQEIVGKPTDKIHDEEDAPKLEKIFKELKRIDQLENIEHWHKRKDGSRFLALASVSAIYENGTPRYISVIKNISDIYEARKKLQEHEKTIHSQLTQLQEIDKLKDEFASMVSHELKSPLFPIKFRAEMLKDPTLYGKLNEKQLEAIDDIYHNSTKLDRLIEDVLDVQRLETNRFTFKYTDVDLEIFLNDVIRNNSTLLHKKQIDFRITTSEKITISTDPNRLHQVFTNLIRNSVDFVPEKTGRIEIGAKRDGDTITFHVKDNGIGIPKDKQDKLFKKFYQIDTSVTRNHGGTGLGLSICKGIVEGLGGKIWVESEEGKGSTFYFTIPVKK